MKDFLSIKEFSKLSGIESSTLRYWDEIGLFSPVERNAENNYRYYTPEQIVAVNFVKVMSGLDVPLKTISKMVASRTPNDIIQLIERQEKQLDMAMRRLRDNYSIIHTRRELINYGNKVLNGYRLADGTQVDVNQIFVTHREERHLVVGQRNEFDENSDYYVPLKCFYEQAKDLRANLGLPIGGMHDSWDDFIKSPGTPHHFFSMDPTSNTIHPAGKYVVGFSFGDYGQFGDLPERGYNDLCRS